MTDARRTLLRRLIWVALGAIAIWFVAALVMVALSGLAARDAARQLDQVRSDLTIEGALQGEGRAELAAAASAMDRAAGLVANPIVAPLNMLPVIGRQVRSLDALAQTSAALLDDGVTALDEVSAVSDSVSDPAGRVAALETMHAAVVTLGETVDRADLGPSEGLIGPLADARNELDQAITDLGDGLADADAVLSGVAAFLRNGQQLLLIANNAEMRAGQGMTLSLAELKTNNGQLMLGEIVPAAEDNLPPGAVPVTADTEQLVANWGWLHPLDDWRNLGVSPRFDVTGPLAAQMWKVSTGRDVDSVLLVDVEAMRVVLAATGPITVNGRTIDADNLVFELLVQQYFNTDVSDRRNGLDDIARAAFDALESGAWDLTTLARGLQVAAEGRHVLAWSADPVQQAAWVAADVAGTLDDRSLLIGTVNRGGNKLDPFLTVDVVTTVDGGSVHAEITVTNDAPNGLPRYAGGPHPNSDGAYGEYIGVLAVSLPGAATDVVLEGGERRVVDGLDGPTRVVAAWFRLPQGARSVFTLDLTLPPGVSDLEVESSARLPPMNWLVDGATRTDVTRSRIST